VTFTGSAANTYAGATTVNEGTLILKKADGVNAVPGRLVIGDGLGGPLADVVRLEAPNQIADTAPVVVTKSGLWKKNTFSDKIGPLTNAGKVLTGDPPTLTVAFDDILATFEGEIEGPGIVVKEGTGTWVLAGANTYEGGTVVAGGTLLVNGSVTSPVTVNAGATLGGTGTTGPVTLQPGAVLSPGGADPAVQRVQDLILSSESSYVAQLNGPDPGTGYDQLDVTGTVQLNGATLDASLGFAPAAGHAFVIVNNDGTDPVAGTFAGLPQGAVVRVGGVPFHISYDGGDGNDVALVRNTPPAVTAPGDRTAFQNVGLAIGGVGVADPDDATVTVTLRVAHGTLTLSPVAGLTVVGDGTGSVSLSGTQAALNAALAGLMYQPLHNYSGPDALAVTATDGLETTSATVAIRVKSLAEQAADLRARVEALRAAGVLNKGQANPLSVKLTLRNNRGDIGRVGAFLNEVGAFVRSGKLSADQAEPLLVGGGILLTGLKRR
jgi:autotransporter-associated beta strand protein